MSSEFYLPSKLYAQDMHLGETATLAASSFIVVLAEPGAGKTKLMESFALRLKSELITAGRIAFSGAPQKGQPLLIDAYDELAKIDAEVTHPLLLNSSEISNNGHMI